MAAEDIYADLRLPPAGAEPPAARPYVIVNMVASLDGKATEGGKAGSMGSSTDRTVMHALRAHAGAVMTGAGTLRAEKLTLAVPEDFARRREARGLKPQPLAVVASTTGDVPLQENLIGSSPDNLLILTSQETRKELLDALSSYASTEVVAAKENAAPGLGGLDLPGALEVLKERHEIEVLLVEGGPALNHALISTGLVDELFMTLAPKLLGGDRHEVFTILEGRALPTQTTEPGLVSVHLSGDELFLRYALRL